jgi:hypothetical protein
MFRTIRVPLALDKFFRPLERHFHWNHFSYFRLLVVVVACMWGRRNVANLYRYLDVKHHRTRFNNFKAHPLGMARVEVGVSQGNQASHPGPPPREGR